MYPRSFCLEAMRHALRAPVRLECGADVARVRQRFYRVRKRDLAQGDPRFVILRFQIDGSTLVISRHPDPVLRKLRYKLRILREMRAIVAEFRTKEGRPIGEIAGAKDSGGDEG